MITAPQLRDELRVGAVSSATANEIRVNLEGDAPLTTALNSGEPRRFPRVNGYLLVPNEAGSVVGIVTWIGVDREGQGTRGLAEEEGRVDLPRTVRRLLLNPIATLKPAVGQGFDLERGVSAMPSIGDPVLLPTREQLRAIVESHGTARRVVIGTAPLAGGAAVAIDPDRLFGRHLAVLGNTGSGKSCSVAGIVRWCLTSADKDREASGRAGGPNARFIILDPNGEYLATFSDLGPTVRVFRPAISGEDTGDALRLTVPGWMWNSNEWAAVTHASPGVQRPLLVRGLRGLRAGRETTEPEELPLARLMRGYLLLLDQLIEQGPASYAGDYRGRQDAGSLLTTLEREVAGLVQAHATHVDELRAAGVAAAQVANARAVQTNAGTRFGAFSQGDLLSVRAPLAALVDALPDAEPLGVASEDSPTPFDVKDLPSYLELLARSADFAQGTQHAAMLVTRIRTLLTDPRLSPIVDPANGEPLAEWLTSLVGAHDAGNGQIAVVDLSLVPSDVLHLAIAVIARLVFEACQRYRKLTSLELPTILVLEEAHTFIQRSSPNPESEDATAVLCRTTFERIAREGRKFGLGLVLSSQRPSELSATALAQCNTFLLHRIVNDRDQELVARLVPDNLGGLLRELPSLPSRQAILLGWATPVPLLVEIADLPPEFRPQSNDPSFWSVWTGDDARPIDWPSVVASWG